MAFWTCHKSANCKTDGHDFDESMMVVQGCYTRIIDDERIRVRAGEEYFIQQGGGMGRTCRRHENDSCFERTTRRKLSQKALL
jgi:uncharacterized cupin superfamily protein